MPYSKAPNVSTYETKSLTLDYDFQSRDGTIGVDSYMENVMVDYLEEKNSTNTRVVVKARPGTIPYATITSGHPRGMYSWGTIGVFYVLDNALYSLASNTPIITLSTTWTDGDVGWCEFQYSTGITALIMSDGANIYVINTSSVATKITTMVTPHLPFPIYLDGYIFIAKKGTADIYNCVLDDPTTWNSGDFITAEMYPDPLVCLSKNNNYLYAIGTDSIEYFYDAGNASGTPLARYAPAVQQFGTPFPLSVVQTEKEVIMLGTTGNGDFTAWVIDGFKAIDISTPAIRRFISRSSSLLTALPTIRGMCMRINGQKLYVVYFAESSIVYSFENKQWTLWSTNTGGSKTGFTGSWFVSFPSVTGYTLEWGLVMSASGQVLHITDSQLTDNNSGSTIPFECNIVTNYLDFGTINKKTMSRLSLLGYDEGQTTGNTYNISWNDYNFNSSGTKPTFTTPRSLSLASDLPAVTQLGAFRRRSIKINCIPTYRFYIEGMEVDINKGTQ